MNRLNDKEKAKNSMLLSIGAAAEKLGISYNTLRDMVIDRKIAFVKVGKRKFLRQQDIDEYIDKNLFEAIEKRSEKKRSKSRPGYVEIDGRLFHV